MKYAPSRSSVARLVEQADTIVEYGAWPRRSDNAIDLYCVERILRLAIPTADRVAILKRLLQEHPSGRSISARPR